MKHIESLLFIDRTVFVIYNHRFTVGIQSIYPLEWTLVKNVQNLCGERTALELIHDEII